MRILVLNRRKREAHHTRGSYSMHRRPLSCKGWARRTDRSPRMAATAERLPISSQTENLDRPGRLIRGGYSRFGPSQISIALCLGCCLKRASARSIASSSACASIVSKVSIRPGAFRKWQRKTRTAVLPGNLGIRNLRAGLPRPKGSRPIIRCGLRG